MFTWNCKIEDGNTVVIIGSKDGALSAFCAGCMIDSADQGFTWMGTHELSRAALAEIIED